MVKILTQVLMLCGYSIYTLTRRFLFFFKKTWGVAEKLLTFLIKIWRVVKRCFKIWHAVNIPIPKMTSCLKLTKNLTFFENHDSKSDAFLKICFKIWFFSKVFVHKLVFMHFFSISSFLRKQITAEVGVLRDKKFQKRFSASKTFIKICFFFKKSNSFRNLICETCFIEIWNVLKL